MNIKNKKFHFIAIGGVGMSALAKYLNQKGAIVSGSDISESKYTHFLKNLGIKVNIGHNKDLISEDMTVIASSAIKPDNPEIVKAKEIGLKIFHRSDILKMISDEFSNDPNACFIGFSGTHGKTTTSGLCSYILSKREKHPSFITGGVIPDLNTNGEFDGKKYFIAELDESDGTISKYSTDIAVINNMEEDHLDFYKNGFKDISKTFNKFLSNKPEQKVVINVDNLGNQIFMKQYPAYNYITFGINSGVYQAKNIKTENLGSEFDIYFREKKIDSLKLSIPGLHNVYNALAVYCALKEAGEEPENYKETFCSFGGMGRRFQKVCEFDNIKIYDDYAHHPSEIKTTLKSAKNSVKSSQRIVAIFQPHRYSRLKMLWEDFKNSFTDSDLLIITDVYSAGETEIEGITSENFSIEVNHPNHVYVKGSINECAEKIYPMLKYNDIVLTLGAGTITNLGRLIESEHKKALTIG